MQACTASKRSGRRSCSPSPTHSAEPRLPRRRPEAPDLPIVPLFDAITRLPQVSRVGAIVYGVIAAFRALGHDPTMQQIAYAAGINDSDNGRDAQRLIADLERLHLVRRVWVRRNYVRYELLGPTWEWPI